jgi:hypothetical protein
MGSCTLVLLRCAYEAAASAATDACASHVLCASNMLPCSSLVEVAAQLHVICIATCRSTCAAGGEVLVKGLFPALLIGSQHQRCLMRLLALACCCP